MMMIAGQLIYDNQLIVQFHCCLYDWLLSSSCQTWFLTCCKLAPYMTSNPLWLMYMRLRNLGMIASAVDLDCTLPENNAFFFLHVLRSDCTCTMTVLYYWAPNVGTLDICHFFGLRKRQLVAWFARGTLPGWTYPWLKYFAQMTI